MFDTEDSGTWGVKRKRVTGLVTLVQVLLRLHSHLNWKERSDYSKCVFFFGLDEIHVNSKMW